jgi:hypothetical protein
MMKSKGTYIGAAVAVVAAFAIIAGLGVHATAGAGTDTDVPAPVLHAPTTLDVPTPAAQPPAAPVEPVGGSQPSDAGNEAGVNEGPAGLPDAGTGPAGSSNVLAEVLVVLGITGLALVGTGAAINTRRSS